MAKKPLTVKQAKFVAAYVGEANGNATEAAAIAGYAGDRQTLGAQGHEVLKNPQVQSALEKALARYSADKVVTRLGEQAEADIGDILTVDEDTGAFQFDLRKAKQLGLTKHIKKLKHDAETGAPVVEFYDSQAALKELAKIHGLSKDDEKPQQNVTQVNIVALLKDLHPAAVAELHRALLAAAPDDIVDAEPTS